MTVVARPQTRSAIVAARRRSKRAVAGLAAVLVATGGLIALGSPTQADVTPVVCASPVALVNGGFEQPALAFSAGFFDFVDQSTVPGWATTASDGLIEIWATGWNGVPAEQGSQFAELNATQASTLYQDVAVTPGQVLRWQLKHRGRSGTDTMRVSVGPVGGPLVSQATLSDGLSWGTHSGVYTVPAGMTVARFAFGSVSTASGFASEGNFLDDISFGTAACLTVAESVSNITRSGSNRVGDILEYESIATNEGGNPADSVTISEVLPAGVTLVPGSITWESPSGATTTVTDAVDADTGEYDSSTRTVRVHTGSVGAGEASRLRYRVTVDAAASDTTLASQSAVNYVEPWSGGALSNVSPGVTVTITPTADLTVTASLSSDLWSGGLLADEPASYLITVTNNGPEIASLSSLTVDLPSLAGRTSTPSGGSCVTTGDQLQCDFGTLPSGATRDVLVTGTVPSSTTSADSFVLAATVSTTSADPVSNDTVTLTTPGADRVSELSLTASADVTPSAHSGAVEVGDTIAHSYDVTNTGNQTMTAITVTDDRNTAIDCPFSTLDPGESMQCTASTTVMVIQSMVDAQIPVTTTGTVQGIPSGQSVAQSFVPASTSVPVTVEDAAIGVDVAVAPVPGSGHALPWAGDTLEWSYLVTNTGNVTLSSIALTDDLGSTITCAVTSLAPGATTPCTASTPTTVTYADVAAGVVEATVTASAVTPSAATVSSTGFASQAIAPADRRLGLVAAATVTPLAHTGAAEVGDTVAMSYVVTNEGNIAVDTVAVTDDRGSTITCAVTTLAPGESTTCTSAPALIVTQADLDASTGIVVTATATGVAADTSGPVSVGPVATVIPVAAADPQLTLTVDSSSPSPNPLPRPGDPVFWTFVATNTGNVTVTLGTIVDDFGSTITCDATVLAPGESAQCEAAAPSIVTVAEANAGVSVNAASVSATAPDATVVTATGARSQPVGMPTPGLQIAGHVTAVSASTGAPKAGDRLRATYLLTNSGNIDVSSIVVTDSVFGTVTCLADTLAVGESTTCEADSTYVVTAADVAAGRVATRATALGDLPTLGLTVSADADLTIAAGEVLASTGSSLGAAPLAAALLLALGAGMLAAGSRRRRARHAG